MITVLTKRGSLVVERSDVLVVHKMPKWDHYSKTSNCSVANDGLLLFCNKCTCQEHEIIRRNTTEENVRIGGKVRRIEEEECKILWFAGMHEDGSCSRVDHSGYQNMYAVALESAIINAGDSLQPVLMLGRLDMESPSKLSKFGSWAKSRGAFVITVPELSFQDVVNQHYSNHNPSHRQGPWLRLEIPRLIKEHNLFNKKENICKDHILYTDSDVIFPNEITKFDIKQLRDELSSSGAMVSYGRESLKRPEISNTGVMVIDVAKFGEAVPGMVNFLKEKGPRIAYDQGLINKYLQVHNDKYRATLLDIHYNWKIYWKVEPSTFDQVKIIHLHGPKPNRGLEAIASCDPNLYSYPDAYDWLVEQGICCDKGRSARWVKETLELMRVAPEDICDD